MSTPDPATTDWVPLWDLNGGGGGGGTPDPHAPSHEPGGSDPLAVDAAGAVGSLRTLGTGAQQAAAGNDARLSDARTPTGPAGGVLSGTFPNPGFAADMATQAELDAAITAAIAKAIMDAKGDLIIGSAADAVARLAVGSDGQVLTADAAQALGVKWATPASGGANMVKLAEVTLGAANAVLLDFTGIDQTYTDLIIRGICRIDTAGAGTGLLQFNGDTGANYDYGQVQGTTTTTSNAAATGTTGIYNCIVAPTATVAGTGSLFETVIPFYANTVWHKAVLTRHGYQHTWNMHGYGNWRSTAAVNRVRMFLGTGNFIAGSRATLWGVK